MNSARLVAVIVAGEKNQKSIFQNLINVIILPSIWFVQSYSSDITKSPVKIICKSISAQLSMSLCGFGSLLQGKQYLASAVSIYYTVFVQVSEIVTLKLRKPYLLLKAQLMLILFQKFPWHIVKFYRLQQVHSRTLFPCFCA